MRKTDVPELNKLLEVLERGQMPNFLEVMAAISDISTLYPDGVQTSQESAESKKSSQLDDLYHQIQPRCIGGNCG